MVNEIYTMPGGLYNDKYTDVPLVSATAKDYDITCGLDEIWWIYGGYIVNGDSVARDLEVSLYNENDKKLAKFVSKAAVAAGGKLYFPYTHAVAADERDYWLVFPIFMKQDWYVRYSWSAGVAGAGGSAAIVLFTRRFP